MNQPSAINPQKIAQLRNLAVQALAFVSQVYLQDLKLVASQYPDWAGLGAGPGNFLAFGEFPTDDSGVLTSLYLPRGIVLDRDLGNPPQPLDELQIREYVTHSWYGYPDGDSVGLHPSEGVTDPNYTGPMPPYEFLDTAGKYSWLKAPRYSQRVMEVGPLARVAVAYAGGRVRIRELVNGFLSALGLTPGALFSTLGRVAARGMDPPAEQMEPWIAQLKTT
jgi:[NiFe] hydrogenase large subunit/hydrogenase large subunit